MSAPRQPGSARRRRRRIFGAAYLLLLLASTLLRWLTPNQLAAGPGEQALQLQVVDGARLGERSVRLVYREYSAPGPPAAPVILLVHGSPGSSSVFSSLAPLLAQRYRVLAVDLPGFGQATRRVPDYSIRAHARYLLQLLEHLDVERAHLVGFSMGGGVILELSDLAPRRVASLTMLSAIGVQEMELFGQYQLNHLMHGLQLGALWLLREGTPHMGWLDDAMLNVPYARNFYDSDQRPLRSILQRYAGPLLIIHGQHDRLVPVQAAHEHHRLVPQSELQLLDEDHFLVFNRSAAVAEHVLRFVERVEAGQATLRAGAAPQRIAAAALPFNPADLPPITGVAALVLACLLVLFTFVSEDLACISAGLLVAQGRSSFLFAAGACFVGIVLGDLLLFWAGRRLGRAALHRAPLAWLVRPQDLERSSAWFARRGASIIFSSRFVPGARLPTYLAAGLLDTSFRRCAAYFLAAAALWAPLLVGLAALVGRETLQQLQLAQQGLFWRLLLPGLLLYLAVRLALALAHHRTRRLLRGWWLRKLRWEFWPLWAFYPPVLAYVGWLGLCYRSLTLFTAANPGMPAGGFVGESKIAILRQLAGAGGLVARSLLLEAAEDAPTRIMQARAFIEGHGLSFPVVLKPNVGQRGAGVQIVRSQARLEQLLQVCGADMILQEYVAGLEFGVFYYRHPAASQGHIFSVTEKRMPSVVGDGRRSLERLILDDERAVCLARLYSSYQREQLLSVPPSGVPVQLAELGSHCRGAIFLDGSRVKTPQLEAAIDQLSKHYAGFYFGRFDIRTPAVEDFMRGENFKVLELNGVTSEATHIYDPRHSLLTAYRILFAQWRLAFAIGAANRARGVQPVPLRALLRQALSYWLQARGHDAARALRATAPLRD